jgi:uncharacterized membrane protein
METQEKPDQETINEWHNDPSNCIWGIFYFNKKDRRILVAKRQIVFGWTVNFANPYSLIVLIGMIALIALAEWLKSN